MLIKGRKTRRREANGTKAEEKRRETHAEQPGGYAFARLPSPRSRI